MPIIIDKMSLSSNKNNEPQASKKKNAKVVIPPKKPKLSKAERRELQERQRAEKAVGGAGGKKVVGGGGEATGGGGKKVEGTTGESPTSASLASGATAIASTVTLQEDNNTIKLFSHLQPYRAPNHRYSVDLGLQQCTIDGGGDDGGGGVGGGGDPSATSSSGPPRIHPAILRLGRKYQEGSIRGSNARCIAMIDAFKHVIRDYETPPGKLLSQDLDNKLKSYFQYLTTECRPHSISMGNAFTFLKLTVATSLSRESTDDEASQVLCDQLDAYVNERIVCAGELIGTFAMSKIRRGDVILVYGWSDVVTSILVRAMRELDGTNNGRTTTTTTAGENVEDDLPPPPPPFRVIVVDSRPLMEGRRTLAALRHASIPCTYLNFNAVGYVMSSEVTKVFLGAAALMSNGNVLGRVGNAGIALMAHSMKVPVLVCCETYKICHRVQLESITNNELGDPEDVARTPSSSSSGNGGGGILSDWRSIPNLKLLNLLYDLTPSEYVSGIVTELGILPPSSVAVILREMNPAQG